MNTFETPMMRAEFERKLYLLGEKIRNGKLLFPRNATMMIESISQVRYLPNGRIDLLSVDEFARLQANMMSQFDDEQFTKAMEANKQGIGDDKAEGDRGGAGDAGAQERDD